RSTPALSRRCSMGPCSKRRTSFASIGLGITTCISAKACIAALASASIASQCHKPSNHCCCGRPSVCYQAPPATSSTRGRFRFAISSASKARGHEGQDAMTNEEIVRDFFAAFARRDYAGMTQHYHADAAFEDPVFGKLLNKQIEVMW